MRITCALGLCLLGLSCRHAAATVSATTGAVQFEPSPPGNLSTGAWESNSIIRVFNERQGFTISQAVAVDITIPGTSPNATDSNLSPGTISAGTVVNVYGLHFDVSGAPPTGSAFEVTGSVKFSEPILGFMVTSTNLNATNGTLGVPNALYPFGSQYDLELNPAGGGTSDVITLSADRRTLTLDWRSASSADNVRVITSVPEPATAGVLLAALAALAIPARRGKSELVLGRVLFVGRILATTNRLRLRFLPKVCIR